MYILSNFLITVILHRLKRKMRQNADGVFS